MFCPHKNSYLQLECDINPRTINRAVEKAMLQPSGCHCQEKSFLRLCSEQPSIPIEGVDCTRAERAFGRWALPKLYKELNSKELIIKLQAISSVSDMVHDPEKAFEALRLHFVRRFVWQLEIYPHNQNEAYKERVLFTLKTLAGYAAGRDEMTKNIKLLRQLMKLIGKQESDNIRCVTAGLIRELTSSPLGIYDLIEAGFVSLLVRRSVEETEDQILIFHLESLERLLFDTKAQEIGFDYEALERMVSLLEHKNMDIVSRASNCLTLLVSHASGKDLSVEINLLIKLNELLHSKNKEVYTCAAAVIMFATQKVRAKHDAAKVNDLPQRLARLTNEFQNPAVQLFSIRALTCICEHPTMRKMFLEYYLDSMKAIITNSNAELENYKANLIKIIEWKPWIG